MIQNRTQDTITRKEKLSYGVFSIGQTIFYSVIALMTTYFTDVGIAPAAVAVVALITKIWDAINDPIFGALMDKIRFKKGKFIPWLRISMIVTPLSTILVFVIPTGIPMWGKVIWATVAYMLWDTAYTICDVPIYGLVTTITGDQTERRNLNNIKGYFGLVAGIALGICVPLFRQSIGGWSSMVILLSLIAAVTMLPICLTGRERVYEKESANEAEENYTLKQMFQCVAKNKYLLIFFSSSIISSFLNVGAGWGLYIARYCYGGEEMASLVTLVSIVPTFIGAALVPFLCKRIDKFRVFYAAVAAGLLINIVRFFVGYHNFAILLVISGVAAVPTGIISLLMFQFTPDCYEYAQYKTGLKMRGLTFAAQTFFTKMATALSTAASTFALTFIGFIEGENAVQAAGFDQKLWIFSCVGGIIGTLVNLVVLHFYKLNDHDVQLMVKCNLGEISHEEADAQMKHQY